MLKKLLLILCTLSLSTFSAAQSTAGGARPRAAELGLKVGVLPTGPLDAITDVKGVEVGHTTIIRGDNIRTGVTAILPHAGNVFRDKVPAGIFVGNGFGKLAGSTQVEEMGEIETPILLTSTMSVPRVADAVISYMLALPGNEDVLSINPVVGETNDGYLNDIRGRYISPEDVFAAIKNAQPGPVAEGAVGACTGTVAFGWKVASERRRVACRRASVDTPWGCSCRPTSEACSQSPVLLSARNSSSTICAKRLRRRLQSKTSRTAPA
jgi:D-aminopeptidase